MNLKPERITYLYLIRTSIRREMISFIYMQTKFSVVRISITLSSYFKLVSILYISILYLFYILANKKANIPHKCYVQQQNNSNILTLVHSKQYKKPMIIRPQSQQIFRSYHNQPSSPLYHLNTKDMRKKIQTFSYDPKDKIGRGYSSIVYKGQNDITKQTVAIKVIQLKSLKDQNTKNFLQNQLECIRKLNHPNTLKYINSFMTGNNCYIVTKFYQEGDLSKKIKKQKQLPEKQVFQIFSQLYDGYCHFYSKGYIHRDIKPSNILISSSGQYVLADYGFIKKLNQNPRQNFNVGTPVYMPPQSLTSNIYTQKSDIWSMGIVLFQLIFGYLPFSSRSDAQLKKQTCSKEIRLSQIQQKTGIYISKQLKNLISSCLRKNPENRIQLFEIRNHKWFRNNSSDQELQTLKAPLNIYTNSKPFNDSNINLERRFPNQLKSSNIQFSYIGNQPIKREKSIQGNGMGLKNYYKQRVTPSYKLDLGIKNYKSQQSTDNILCKQSKPYYYQEQNKQNMNQNAINIKQKFKQLDELVEKSNKRIKELNQFKDFQNLPINNSIQYNNVTNEMQNQQLQRKDEKRPINKIINSHINNFDLKIRQPTRANNPLKKVQIARNKESKVSSNTQIIKIKSKKMQESNQQYSLNLRKQRSVDTYLQHSNKNINLQRIQQRQSLLDGIKSMIHIKNNHISSAISTRAQTPNPHSNTNIQQKYAKPLTPSPTLLNQQLSRDSINALVKFKSQQLYKDVVKSSQDDQIMNLIKKKTNIEKPNISHNEFLIRVIHLLRFMYQTIKLQINQKDRLSQNGTIIMEGKRLLISYFAILLNKLLKAANQKQNVFNLSLWDQFLKDHKFMVFQNVMQQYEEKFKSHKDINEALQNISTHSFLQSQIQSNISRINVKILLSSQTFTHKKIEQKNSFQTNSKIKCHYYISKCLESMKDILCMGIKQYFNENNPKQLIDSFQKNDDPFKIPKMLIELKKKILCLQQQKKLKH